jgi:hypothetical protein
MFRKRAYISSFVWILLERLSLVIIRNVLCKWNGSSPHVLFNKILGHIFLVISQSFQVRKTLTFSFRNIFFPRLLKNECILVGYWLKEWYQFHAPCRIYWIPRLSANHIPRMYFHSITADRQSDAFVNNKSRIA